MPKKVVDQLFRPVTLKPTNHRTRVNGLITFDHTKVAAVYMEALALNLSPIQTLQQVFDIPFGRARHWLGIVESEGRLARDGHRAVRAVLRRYASDKETWLACEQCRYPWPCPTVLPDVETASTDRAARKAQEAIERKKANERAKQQRRIRVIPYRGRQGTVRPRAESPETRDVEGVDPDRSHGHGDPG